MLILARCIIASCQAMPSCILPSKLKIASLVLVLLAGFLGACARQGSSAVEAELQPPRSDLSDFISDADAFAVNQRLQQYQSDFDAEEFFNAALKLYETCISVRRADLVDVVNKQLRAALKRLSQSERELGSLEWLDHWQIRKTLADIRWQSSRRNLLTARKTLEQLLSRHPEVLLPAHPLSEVVNRVRLNLYDQLELTRLSVLTIWQILKHETSTQQRRELHNRLWILLDTMSSVTRQSFYQEIDDAELKVFIDLVLLWRESLYARDSLWSQSALEYADHPAMEFDIPRALLAQEQQINDQPGKVALLLPLSGELASVGQAIRDGFISAAWQQANLLDTSIPRIDIYDTTIYGSNINYVLDQALGNGAELIVGPLRKEMVKKTISAGVAVPIVALNYESDALIPGEPPESGRRQIQMSLSDEDELWQIVRLFDQLGVRAAGVLLPDSKLGRRLQVFLQDYANLYRMRANLVFEFYAPYEFDHSKAIRRLLDIDESQQRARLTQRRLGLEVVHKPRLRSDINTVLIIADGQQVLSLYSQIRFQAQKPIPVITTSRSYAQGRNLAQDLDGLYITLMPWLITPSANLTSIKDRWNDRYTDLSYFFTFGIDAWNVVSYYRPLLEFDHLKIPIHTGTVRLDEYGRLRREYVWAKFVNGRTVEFDPAQLKDAIEAKWVPLWKRKLLLD